MIGQAWCTVDWFTGVTPLRGTQSLRETSSSPVNVLQVYHSLTHLCTVVHEKGHYDRSR